LGAGFLREGGCSARPNLDTVVVFHAATIGVPLRSFHLALEAAPTGMLMVDAKGTIVFVNAQIERLFGYPREALVGQPVEVLIPERFRGGHPGERGRFFAAPSTRPMGGGRELFGLRSDGTEIRIEIGLNPLTTPEGSLVLLQEVHHRVKNNLQVISSLINMQVRKLKTRGAETDALLECQTRVQAIAMIHEQLYQSKDYAHIPFSNYVRSLATSVFDALEVSGFGPSRGAVSLHLSIDDVAISVDRAIPCGLILNELITNALKHAFPLGRRGEVHVELKRQSGRRLMLVVRDDGVGLSDRVDIHRANSLGLQLVRTLAEQLDANLEVTSEAGASFSLSFEEGPSS
jgi:PAS domain S-box-containing protein